jgi:hypothetical protein
VLAWSFVRGYGTLGATIERGGLNVVCRISTTTILALSDVKLVLKSLVVGLLLVLVGVLEAVRSRFAVAFTGKVYLRVSGILHTFVNDGEIVTSSAV